MKLTPQYYKLNSRTQLEELAPQQIAIVKRIKSRIIRKDAEKIVAMAKQIQEVEPTYQVSLVCNDNICSKSLKLLGENGIEVKY